MKFIANLYDEIEKQKTINKVVINSILFILIPLMIIVAYRTDLKISGLHFNLIFFLPLFIYSFFQFKRSKEVNTKNTSKLTRITNIFMFYILLPMTLPYIFSLTLYPLKFIIGDNVQNLDKVTTSKIIPNLIETSFAGLEEVWKLSIIFLIVYFVTLLAKEKLNNTKKSIVIILAMLISSFVFGWLHTFGYSDVWFNPKITLGVSILGLDLVILFLITRRLWTAILTHSMFDIYNVLSRFDVTLFELINLVVFIVTIASSFIFLYMQRKEWGKDEEITT